MSVSSAQSVPSVLDQALVAAMSLQGALSAAIAELDSGRCLARANDGDIISLSAAATMNARVLRARLEMVQGLGHQEGIEDILIAPSRYHLTRVIPSTDGRPGMFLYLVLDRAQANLAIARRALAEIEKILVSGSNVLQLLDEALTSLQTASIASEISRMDNVPYEDEYDDNEELPAFMREDTVLKILGLACATGRTSHA